MGLPRGRLMLATTSALWRLFHHTFIRPHSVSHDGGYKRHSEVLTARDIASTGMAVCALSAYALAHGDPKMTKMTTQFLIHVFSGSPSPAGAARTLAALLARSNRAWGCNAAVHRSLSRSSYDIGFNLPGGHLCPPNGASGATVHPPS